MARVAGAIDGDFYIAAYDDVRDAGLDPVWHYCAHGWREGRNPSAHFDTRHYLTAYPDVMLSAGNPLLHYLNHGASENRQPRAPEVDDDDVQKSESQAKDRSGYDDVEWGQLGWRISVMRDRFVHAADAPIQVAWANRLHDVHYTLEEDRRVLHGDLPISMGPPGWTAGAQQLLAGLPGRVVISVSHDDAFVSVGGVQSIVMFETTDFCSRGFLCLHLRPQVTLHHTLSVTDPKRFLFGVRLNGEVAGIADEAMLGTLLDGWRDAGVAVHWVVHHLLAHSPEALAALMARHTTGRPAFWIHDYFMMCGSYNLLRNGVAPCGLNHSDATQECQVCAFGDKRHNHVKRIRGFLDDVRPIMVAPSDFVAKVVQSRWGGHAPLPPMVVEPAQLTDMRHKAPVHRLGPLRVAFVGHQAFHKGWAVFERLARVLEHDKRFVFHRFGLGKSCLPFIESHAVKVSAQMPHAMIDQVRASQIDVVICWSLWAENFCFAVHEMLAAGTFVVYRKGQGHVDHVLRERGGSQSHGLAGEAELVHYFISGRVLKDYADATCYQGNLVWQNGSAVALDIEQTEDCMLHERDVLLSRPRADPVPERASAPS